MCIVTVNAIIVRNIIVICSGKELDMRVLLKIALIMNSKHVERKTGIKRKLDVSKTVDTKQLFPSTLVFSAKQNTIAKKNEIIKIVKMKFLIFELFVGQLSFFCFNLRSVLCLPITVCRCKTAVMRSLFCFQLFVSLIRFQCLSK